MEVRRGLQQRRTLYCAPHFKSLSWLPDHSVGLRDQAGWCSLLWRPLNSMVSWRSPLQAKTLDDAYYVDKHIFNLKIFLYMKMATHAWPLLFKFLFNKVIIFKFMIKNNINNSLVLSTYHVCQALHLHYLI